MGHVRFTDRDAIDQTLRENLGIIGSLETVFSMYEDLYVEGMMGACFPGCRRNLRKLVSLVFAEKRQAALPARDILQGLLVLKNRPRDLNPWRKFRIPVRFKIR